MTVQLPICVAAVAVALSLPATATDSLLPDWGQDVPKFAPSTPGRQYAIALKPEWRGLRLQAEMKATDIRRGKDGWNTGRITVTFHDAAGKLVGRRYPLQQEVLGTTDWKKVDYEYLIPKGAAKVHVGFHNLGASGIAEFRSPSLVPSRGWITQPCDAKAPPDCPDGGTFVPAVEAVHVSLDLSGWWRCRPSFADEKDAFVPAEGDNWGWSKLPSVWRNGQRAAAPSRSCRCGLIAAIDLCHSCPRGRVPPRRFAAPLRGRLHPSSRAGLRPVIDNNRNLRLKPALQAQSSSAILRSVLKEVLASTDYAASVAMANGWRVRAGLEKSKNKDKEVVLCQRWR